MKKDLPLKQNTKNPEGEVTKLTDIQSTLAKASTITISGDK